MFEIGDKVVSLDVIREHFVCDLEQCKGICCVEGESGAPLEEEEVDLLSKEIESIKPYLRSEGIRAIEQQGTSLMDAEQEMVTPLNAGKECAYAIFENGIARCGIEKAYEEGATNFRKPVSCHIYPIRVKHYKGFKAINYDRWPICDPARICGSRHKTPVYRFVQSAIERKYGKDFFEKLEIIAGTISKEE